jgi:hypothetical protein
MCWSLLVPYRTKYNPILHPAKFTNPLGLGSRFQGLDTNQECCYQLPISGYLIRIVIKGRPTVLLEILFSLFAAEARGGTEATTNDSRSVLRRAKNATDVVWHVWKDR